MTRTERERRALHRRLAKKSPEELDKIAAQVPFKFHPQETLEEKVARIFPYWKRGWVEL